MEQMDRNPTAERRVKLQAMLEEALGSRNVYYQPPPTVQMRYPAIVYSRSDVWKRPADNLPYQDFTAYSVIVIDRNPDSLIVERVKKLPYCRFSRHYVSDNLNHDSFTIYI